MRVTLKLYVTDDNGCNAKLTEVKIDPQGNVSVSGAKEPLKEQPTKEKTVQEK